MSNVMVDQSSDVEFSNSVEPLEPISFDEFTDKKYKEVFDCIIKRGIGESLQGEIKGLLQDFLNWQEEVDEWDQFQVKKLNEVKKHVKVKNVKKKQVKKPAKKVTVKKAAKAKPKRK